MSEATEHAISQTNPVEDEKTLSRVRTQPKAPRLLKSTRAIAAEYGPSAEPDLPRISVGTEALEMFQHMFRGSSVSMSVKWQRFVAAMVEAGCSATNNGGSTVTFKHAHGTIALHKPHPVAIVNPVMLHAIGKRFGKRLGWHAGLFVERQDGGQ